MTDNRPQHNHIAIIGSGFGGLATAIQLQKQGFRDMVILERAAEVGGVWRDNTYPGAAVDVQCQLYSFSFAPNPHWRNMYARQPEIHAYLKGVATRFGLDQYLKLNCAVTQLTWDGSRQLWHLQTAHGERTAAHVVVATGALAEPVVPDLPGLNRFAGRTFHSARWDHKVDLASKRVAVVGTGASAVQFVPAIRPTVGHMTVFQRTPHWVMPRHDRAIGARTQKLFAVMPRLQRLQRLRIYLQREWIVFGFHHPWLMRAAEQRARRHLRSQVSDPDLRSRLLPDYRLGCKRILLSDDYLAALDQPNVTLNAAGISDIDEYGITDKNGVHHPADAIIFGTGFDTTRLPLTDAIYRPDGRSMAQEWADNPTAHLGTTVAGFPNCYLVHGPNIGVGHTSVVYMIESQANYITEAIQYAHTHGIAAIEPTVAAQDAFTADVDQLSAASVWTEGGCNSWYLNATGRNINLWPGATFDFRRRARFDPADHVMHSARSPITAAQ